ncbi:MAG: MBL fold metallo-hydrolase [Thermodesulfobacteriota bacterium]
MSQILHIEIKQDRPGFDRFFGCWVIRDERSVLVDVGPAATAGRLLEGLEAAGVDRVDWVLLTHIHIDHAGGLAAVLDRFPGAKAVSHEKGLRFLADPAKLWEGSLAVLGDLARFYGRPPAVDEDRLAPHTEPGLDGLRVIETPGHAPHHLSFSYRGRLFTGEAGGNFFLLGGRGYLRPSTPPRFFLETALASVDRLLELPDQPVHYAHFEEAGSSREMLGRFRDQLPRWRDIIAREAGRGGIEGLETRCVEALLAQDPEIESFRLMAPQAQSRERRFIANSVRGFLGFLGVEGYQ